MGKNKIKFKQVWKTLKDKFASFVLCTIIFICIMFSPLNFHWHNALQGLFFSQWQTTKGVIVSSKIVNSGQGKYLGDVIRAKYEYYVDGKLYQSDRSSFSVGNNYGGWYFSRYFLSNDDINASEYQKKYCQPGTPVIVYYESKNPKNSTLQLGVNWRDISLCFFVFGVFLIMFYWLIFSWG